ncbi:hypothetical protein LMG29542_07703 [Paraburkholderia humisilvae]|uniref:Uncharacterized protein n=1 Tax=Paraburkholderia humisilvae TaxID=627669 RepID=A0A6J5F636_9BURK|nr:hypothetical protein LMG29542_07703 [Paraburkholderia humisilvae]
MRFNRLRLYVAGQHSHIMVDDIGTVRRASEVQQHDKRCRIIGERAELRVRCSERIGEQIARLQRANPRDKASPLFVARLRGRLLAEPGVRCRAVVAGLQRVTRDLRIPLVSPFRIVLRQARIEIRREPRQTGRRRAPREPFEIAWRPLVTRGPCQTLAQVGQRGCTARVGFGEREGPLLRNRETQHRCRAPHVVGTQRIHSVGDALRVIGTTEIQVLRTEQRQELLIVRLHA